MVSWKQSVVVMSQVFCWRGRTSSVSLQSQHITKMGLNGELETGGCGHKSGSPPMGVGLFQSAYRAGI